MTANRSFRMSATLGIGAAGALLAKLAGMPLPFLLGPLILSAAAGLAGLPLQVVPFGREAAQVVIGLSIGLRFLPEVAIATGALLPLMVAATFLTISATMLAAFLLARIGGIDRRTAFFATSAAGLAEMAVVAHRKRADADIVSVVHLIRVTSIVMIAPLLAAYAGTEGHVPDARTALGDHLLVVILLLLAAGLAAWLLRSLRVPNLWLLVPAAVGGLAAGTGLVAERLPGPLLIAAQVVIGVWIGCRFRREVMSRMPRVTVSAFATTALLLAFACLVALALAAVAGLPFNTALLAVAPAGVTEMSLTAAALHLDAATVTAFQMMRIATVMIMLPLTYRLFEWCSDRLDAKDT